MPQPIVRKYLSLSFQDLKEAGRLLTLQIKLLGDPRDKNIQTHEQLYTLML